jgi:hypothetical protein
MKSNNFLLASDPLDDKSRPVDVMGCSASRQSDAVETFSLTSQPQSPRLRHADVAATMSDVGTAPQSKKGLI